VDQAALPAASVVLLLALGSGVSVAVTGNPMAPVSGVSKVVSELPGVAESKPTYASVTDKIVAAGRAAENHQPARAAALLAEAKESVGDLPAAQQAQLNLQIAQVQSALTDPDRLVLPDPTPTADPVLVADPPPTTTETEPPQTTVEPTQEPSTSTSEATEEPSETSTAPATTDEPSQSAAVAETDTEAP
jgi:hypothetical protein